MRDFAKYFRNISVPFLLIIHGLCFADGGNEFYDCYQVGIHFDSNISGGYYPPDTLIEFAIDNKLDAIIFCDHDRMEAEFGIPPLRNIIKKKIEKPSLKSFGFASYINFLDSLNTANPNLTVISGSEVNPCYYWTGDPFSRMWQDKTITKDYLSFKDLTLNNWHQHMMVIGLKDAEDYENLPATSSHLHYGWDYYLNLPFLELVKQRIILDIFAFFGIILCIFLFFRRKIAKVDFEMTKIAVRKKPPRVKASLLFILCSVILVNDYPFTPWKYSPYDGDNRLKAAQELIDYTVERGGLIYYAHPEAEFKGSSGGIGALTSDYSDLLLKTDNYTGFAVFAEGFKKAGKPGGIWDKILMEYLEGKRLKPVWIVGELDFEGDLPPNFLQEVGTFVWAENKSEKALLDALSDGRCYASQIWGPKQIWLDEWYYIDRGSTSYKDGHAVINITVRADLQVTNDDSILAHDKRKFTAQLVKNGEIVQTDNFADSLQIEFNHTVIVGKTYFRLWVLRGGIPILASNPLFINITTSEWKEF